MSRRRSPVATDRRFRKASLSSDTGPLERWQHSGRTLIPTETRGFLAARTTEESVLDILVLRGVLEEKMRDAALRLKEDYLGASLSTPTTARYAGCLNRSDRRTTERERTDAEESAYQRWRKGLQQMEPNCRDAVMSTACLDMLPPGRDILRLRKGLVTLVKWYRL